MEIKTLAQILAESKTDSANPTAVKDSVTTEHHATARLSPPRLKSSDNKRSQSQPRSQQSATKSENHQSRPYHRGKKSDQMSPHLSPPAYSDNSAHTQTSPQSKKRRQEHRFHPASSYTPKDLQGNPLTITDTSTSLGLAEADDSNRPTSKPTIKSLLAELKPASTLSQSDTQAPLAPTHHLNLANISQALDGHLMTPEERHAKKEAIKADSRLRWLAFYYLSRREYARGELKQKLLDKDQDPKKIEALLDEFAQKGYQSDWRTALMLIREGIRKGRGRSRIKQDFYKRKLDMPSNIDELIDMASHESDEFADFIDSDHSKGVDWLKLAVEARVKKYGDSPPKSPKEKARQLRFLQYRGFKSDICFEALRHNLATLADRS